MAWSEAVYTIQQLSEKIENEIESKLPLIAKSVNGLPENISIENLKPGIIWYIQEEDLTIKSFCIFTKDGFSNPIPLNTEWN